ncbi:MAG: PH domain-containing protein [Bifidobacterium aquikefiri]|uniref:Bacterial PH domain-containing protein n=1 Tax=Bifidobacterium aquikefiri TaxID=1653207 RepID=A0A261G8W0_9BIFI|nr:PH domain-containing protein [Bifidobacterium aquikefiri]OZG67643.1 Bacterial PH domain-containing protein [Bifidobacterium aquikefiri]
MGEAHEETDQNNSWLATQQWRRLPLRVKMVWMLSTIFGQGFVLILCALAAVFFPRWGWWGSWQRIVIVVIAVLSGIRIIVQPLFSRYEYAINRFSIGEHQVIIRRGWFWRNLTVVPYNRVQHVDTRQGPVLRMFSLTAVAIHTAVGSEDIEALNSDEALQVVEQITAKVLATKEDL